jgi:DNA polymerase (family 10)
MPRPRAITRSDDALLTNSELARIFREIGDMLEILGEVVYKSVAYRRVADAIERYPEDVAALYRRGTPPKLPGAGPALSTKLAELSETGQLAYHEKLRAQVPQGLLDMLRISGVGPRTVKLLHDERGIDSVDALQAAAADGQLRGIKGLSERTEQNILAGIAHMERKISRVLLHEADEMIAGLLTHLREVPGVVHIEPAGSLRRRKPTIGDLDLLAATENPAALIATLDGLTDVDRVLAAGVDKSSILLANSGLRVDLMVCPPTAWGSHLVHFTGSKEHNVALRGIALDRGLSLSEKGFNVVESGELLLDDTEEAVYARLSLPWIPPEMREDTDVIAAAQKGAMPTPVAVGDLRGDTHVHSDWTDGVDSIEVMARAARDRGLQWMVLTDHSPSLGIARGLPPQRIDEQRAEIARLNAELAPFRILHGTEMEVRADGSLDYPDELLAAFEVVVASVHTARNQPSEQLTARTLAAIENPHVDVIAHPTGRIVNRRDPMPLDWPRIFEAAARTGTMLEMNGSPRLDMDDVLGRAATEAGCRVTLASDAHRTEELSQLDYAVSMARRGWVTADRVAGAADADAFLDSLR